MLNAILIGIFTGIGTILAGFGGMIALDIYNGVE